ncbi:acetyl-CoA decarbonylase/synthase complex subunit gamma [Methanolapillus millepedarum]|uniref:Corrinoid/iron-sulfur protein large subunit n=1 Tax=Methanolapillus millepedarum TaxID=3028296 RepID=A0AA96V287_9EURY|nr:Corrinoid/iron-sulfur protein large subunit [Methanosarcinaceae archaeon Ac7]
MRKAKSPLDVYMYLPPDSEKLFGKSKMAMASDLVSRKVRLPEIKEAFLSQNTPESERDFKTLEALLRPTISEIQIGAGERTVTIGGDDVMFRHTLSFYNKTPIAVDVWDTMTDAALLERVEKIQSFRKFYVGRFLHPDMIAVRSVSNDPETFGNCVRTILKKCDLPLILCTKNPTVMRAGLLAAAGQHPLIYACDVRNRTEMAELALEFDAPLVVCSNGNLDELKSLSAALQEDGVTKLVLNPGAGCGDDEIGQTFLNFIRIRKAALDGDQDLAYPLIALPIASWERMKSKCNSAIHAGQNVVSKTDSVPIEDTFAEAAYFETMTAASLVVRYADILIIHGLLPYEMLPLLHVTEMIYTDPRTPASVEPKMYKIGNPTAESPVLFTTNFALTFYTVESDLSSSNVDCYLLSANTGGLGVEAAVAGGQLTAGVIKAGFDHAEFDWDATACKTLILPGLAARLQNDIEKEMDISTLVGPMDSGRLSKWLEENWPPKK